ncbi:MAG: type IV pili methyl-accepting chemotaxis transducer N-terminal domain-containing protein [Armatimonadota bacterium]|nr:type IV pili methyl-accepting chemotaxis transducer N-terminal domain-containing protein [Armatimonadota bacterium]
MPRSLVGRFALLFGGFLLLVFLSGFSTFHLTTIQRQDALVMNLAGRQRMLVQTMVRRALAQAVKPSEINAQALEEAFRTFNATLAALRSGGQAPYLPGSIATIPVPSDSETTARLDEVARLWDGFRAQVQALIASKPGEPEFFQALGEIDRLSGPLLAATDAAVRSFERTATRRVERLRWLQGAFILTALGLLAGGSWWTYRKVVGPLHRLEQIAHRIGHGDFASPVPYVGIGEINRLAKSLETMRQQLKIAHDDLESRVSARARELEAIYEVGQDMVSRLEVGQILDSVVRKARMLLGGEAAALCLVDESGGTLHLAAFSGPKEVLKGNHTRVGNGLSHNMVLGQKAVFHCTNCEETCCALIAMPFAHNHLAAPLRIRGELLGALCVITSETHHIPPEGSRLLGMLADAAAIALNNARLYQQGKELAALEEREYIAREMHDSLAQTLSYLHLQVDAALEELTQGTDVRDRLMRVRETLLRVAQDVRAIITTLHTRTVFPRSLGESLRQVLSQTIQGFPIDGAAKLEIVEDWTVPPETATEVQRIVQEAVTNACRYARAHHVAVRLYQEEGMGVVCVEDDGIGFDPQRLPDDGRPHFGLSIMQARAARIGGQLMIHSAPGRGTRVLLRWPLRSGTENT